VIIAPIFSLIHFNEPELLKKKTIKMQEIETLFSNFHSPGKNKNEVHFE
jgi:hypothetical protein